MIHQKTIWNNYMRSPFSLSLTLGYSYLRKVVGQKSLNRILFEIKHGSSKYPVSRIRQLIRDGNEREAQIIKKRLLAFCASATFDTYRNHYHIKEQNNLIVLDIDYVSLNELNDLRTRINEIPNTICSFLSPSGRGFKILCEVDNRLDFPFQFAYQRVVRFYEELLSIDFDDSTNDETRLCYYSYDPQLYINPNFETLSI